jgi:two-component system sensor histidine kinase KdpD
VNLRTFERICWVLAATAMTAVLLRFRAVISDAHVALAYLLIVLGASARDGRKLGLSLALLCFLSFNYFFIPPYYTFAIHHRLDYLVLLAFLGASTVATQLLHRARSEAETAGRRAREIDRLAAVGAEALNAPRAVDAVQAVANVVQAGLHVAACEIYMLDASSAVLTRIVRATGKQQDTSFDAPAVHTLERAAAGLVIGESGDGSSYVAGEPAALSAGDLTISVDTHALLIPLRVGDRAIGVLRIDNGNAMTLDSPQQRFTEALAYYAALALDRVNLAATAEHAEALREADRLKDALLASISHDLRTPLTTIKALAHDLAEGGDERAVVIEEEADRLNRFVSDLLDLSRLNAGAGSLKTELVAAEDVLGAALQRVLGATAGRTVRAVIDPGDPILVGHIDFVHTLRALVNLIENALKYSPADGVVDVTVRRERDCVVFEVGDRGPGVPDADRERIFEPFVRGDTASAAGGAGLGLAIARRSVELQHGTLTCSPRQGGGSVFQVRLPSATDAELEKMSL